MAGRPTCSGEQDPSPDSLERLRSLADSFAKSKKKPMVGLFWYHRRRVVGDFYDLDKADLYGDVLGPHANHYRFWRKIQKMFPDLMDVDYEYVPRGRVLFDLVAGKFVLISSAQIISSNTAGKAANRWRWM